MVEPKVTLNKHKTSSPLGVSALCSGSKEDGHPQSTGSVLLTESQLNSPLGQSLSDQACLCQGPHPRGLLFVVGFMVQLDGRVISGQALPETGDRKGGCGRQ